MATAYLDRTSLKANLLGDSGLTREENVYGASTLVYDSVSDDLEIWINGTARAHYAEPVNTFLSFLLDLEDDRLLGARVDNFTAFAIHTYPGLKPLAAYLDLADRRSGDTDLITRRIVSETVEPNELYADGARETIARITEITGGPDVP